jgi:hypothetical protein
MAKRTILVTGASDWVIPPKDSCEYFALYIILFFPLPKSIVMRLLNR